LRTRRGRFCQPDHLHPAIGVRGAAIEVTGFDRRSTNPVTLPFETIMRFETSDSVMPSGTCRAGPSGRSGGSVTFKPLAQPAAYLALDQGRAGQQAEHNRSFVAMLVREFDGLGLGNRGFMMRSICQFVLGRSRASQVSCLRDIGLQ